MYEERNYINDYCKVAEYAETVDRQGGIRYNPSVNKHALKHGVSQEEAQSYIDNAVVMFDQGSRSLYISNEGNSVILDTEKRLISAYRKADFDLGINAILEVVKNG